MSFSPSNFLANFSATSQAIVDQLLSEKHVGLTQPSLVDLFRRESEHGQ